MNFDEEIARELGVECAILLSNIQFWVKKNRANGEEKHFHEGRWWTYNSAGSFAKLFPYWKERTVYSYIDKLEKAGYIICGNFNKFKYDRTKWYTSETEKSLIIPIRKKLQMDLPKTADGSAESANASTENCGPIPYINSDIKTDVNSYVSAGAEIDKKIILNLIDYFYKAIAPLTPFNVRRNKYNKAAAESLLKNKEYGDILKVIVKAAAIQSDRYSPKPLSLQDFAIKYQTIENYGASAPKMQKTIIV